MADVTGFYDDLSAHYHLIFDDWDAAVVRQGRDLSDLIARLAGPGPKRLLDCTCGIGTQAIGLALQGHQVTGTDISPAAVARARREAERFGVALTAEVADMRRLSESLQGPFELVCSFHNALPHLQSDEELVTALGEMAALLAPDGLLLANIRDYDEILKQRPRTTPLRVIEEPGGRRLVFQVWDWEGDCYRFSIYIVRDHGETIETLVFPASYRALTRSRLNEALAQAGFAAPRWLDPEESGYYQPIVAARISA